MISLKPGVRLFGLRPELLFAIMVAKEVYTSEAIGGELVITSVMDGTHSLGSKHYAGCAVDLRTSNLHSGSSGEIVRKRISDALGGDFDVLFEGDHIHIEYDPKTPY